MGNDYSVLEPLVKEKVKAIICLGTKTENLFEAFSTIINTIVKTTNMTDAVQLAYNFAHKGDVILLSPACASFDLFENYEERGRRF